MDNTQMPYTQEAKIVEIDTNVKNLSRNFEEFKNNHFGELKVKVDKIIEKMSKPRLPMWATWMFTIGGSLITGLVIYAVTRR